ncbi:MFS transporter [Hafnia psychrotolerans]|uniref:MFS transporter n=1 Tax=Hafnia psychrotolerans TaxID=1477018 RepID=A0ABQ1GIZ7_9GAMM|nr:MFS transporter [Hafnia psychrotolerans]GGA44552.1 MFS transporter [Hafnia psychrotolerans]
MRNRKNYNHAEIENEKNNSKIALIISTSGFGLTQIIGWGTIFYPPAIISSQIGVAVGLTEEHVYFGITIMMLVGALSSPKLGKIIDKHGARTPIILGCLITALSLLLMAVVNNPYSFWVSWALLGLASPLVITSGAYTALVQVTGNNARKAVSALSLFSGFSSTLFYPATHYLVLHYGWREMYVIYATLHLLICMPIFIKLLPKEYNKKIVNEKTTTTKTTPNNTNLILINFFILILVNTMISAGLTLHLYKLFGLLGLSTSVAVFAVSLTGPTQVIGRIIELTTGRNHSPLSTALFSTIIQVISFVIIIYVNSSKVIWLFIILYGLSNGLMTIVRVALPLILFGSKDYGRSSGIINFGFSLTNAIAPVAFANIIENYGAKVIFVICLILSFFSFSTCLLLKYLFNQLIKPKNES